MKRQGFSSCFVALAVVLLSASPFCSRAQFTFTTNNGAITITGYTGINAEVVIPDTTNGYPVKTIGDSAFENNTILKSVTFGTNVTSIGADVFWDCPNLMKVTIPNSVTNIGIQAFYGCPSLQSITIPGSVTRIGDGAFSDCYGLTNFDISTLNPSYSSVEGVWFNKAMTTLIQYPASRIGSYVIPAGVTSIGIFAFGSSSGLANVVIPDSVTDISGGAFDLCSGLTSMTLPNSVTNIGNDAFYGCSSLTNIMIGNRVTKISDWTFAYCSGLKAMWIPSSVLNIGDYAFYDCSSLTNVMIPNNVTNVGYSAFEFCTSLQQAYFQGNAPSVNGGAGGTDSSVFARESGTAYYLPGTTGWGATFGGWPTAQWYQPKPQILGSGYGLGVQSNRFKFMISWATNTAVVVEASTNLQNWMPVITNTLANGTNAFSDSAYTNFPKRFYRVRSQ